MREWKKESISLFTIRAKDTTGHFAKGYKQGSLFGKHPGIQKRMIHYGW